MLLSMRRLNTSSDDEYDWQWLGCYIGIWTDYIESQGSSVNEFYEQLAKVRITNDDDDDDEEEEEDHDDLTPPAC